MEVPVNIYTGITVVVVLLILYYYHIEYTRLTEINERYKKIIDKHLQEDMKNISNTRKFSPVKIDEMIEKV